MKAVIAILVGTLAGGFLLLALLLGLHRLWDGWPAAILLIMLTYFPALWLIGGLGWVRMAEARERGTSVWLSLLGLACPRCSQAPMSPPRKWLMRRLSTARCRHCGLLLTNDSLPAMVLLAPPLLALLMAPIIGALVRGIQPWYTLAWLLAVGCMVALFIGLTRRFLPCEPLASTVAVTESGRTSTNSSRTPS